MSRDIIARQIAEELLDTETLDIHNHNGNAEAILEYTEKVILKHLQDYLIISGDLV